MPGKGREGIPQSARWAGRRRGRTDFAACAGAGGAEGSRSASPITKVKILLSQVMVHSPTVHVRRLFKGAMLCPSTKVCYPPRYENHRSGTGLVVRIAHGLVRFRHRHRKRFGNVFRRLWVTFTLPKGAGRPSVTRAAARLSNRRRKPHGPWAKRRQQPPVGADGKHRCSGLQSREGLASQGP